MKVGVAAFITDETARPDAVARLVEEYGLDSFWLPDHTHIPSARYSLHPTAKRDLPREYLRNLDAFTALAAAATATKTIGIGTAICLITERDPIITAKTVATLDVLSGGRMMLGVGAGWNLEELENHGVAPKDRFKVLDERVEAMKAIWANDVASFDGRFVSFDSIWSWPKPVQTPELPVLLGSNGERAIDRAIRLGTHWMPGYHKDDELLISRIAEFRERTEDRFEVTLNAPPIERSRLSRLAEAGATRAIFMLPSAGVDEVERHLEDVQRATADL